MDRGHFEKIREMCGERLAAALAASDERFDGWVERMERSEQHFIEALAENSAEIKLLGEEGERRTERMVREMRDSSEQTRANTRAVLSILDRLDGLEGGSAAG